MTLTKLVKIKTTFLVNLRLTLLKMDKTHLKMEQTQQNYITLPGGLLTDEQWEWWNERENYFRELRLKESELRLKEKEMELEKMEERFIQFVMNERQFSYQQASDFIKSYSPKKKTGLLQTVKSKLLKLVMLIYKQPKMLIINSPKMVINI